MISVSIHTHMTMYMKSILYISIFIHNYSIFYVYKAKLLKMCSLIFIHKEYRRTE